MNQPAPGRRFSQQEFAVLLRKAADLQARSPAARSEGFTLAEMEQIASEAGIPGEYLRQAVLQPDVTELSFRERFLGAPASFEISCSIDGTLDDETVHQIIDEARRFFGKSGSVQTVLDAVEWQHRDELGAVTARVTRRGGRTRVHVTADREVAATLALVLPTVGIIVTGIVAAIIGLDESATGAVAVAAGLSVLGVRFAWRANMRSWRNRLTRALDRMASLVGTPQP